MVCHNCGYCEHCGRSNQPMQPYWAWMPPVIPGVTVPAPTFVPSPFIPVVGNDTTSGSYSTWGVEGHEWTRL